MTNPVIEALRGYLIASTKYKSYIVGDTLITLVHEETHTYIAADNHVWSINGPREIPGYLSMWAEINGHNKRVIEIDYSNPQAFDLIVDQLDSLAAFIIEKGNREYKSSTT